MGSLDKSWARQDVHIICAAIPAYGHVRSLRSLARSLATRGFPVSFITGPVHKQSIEAIQGVEFVPLQGKANFDLDRMSEQFPLRKNFKGPAVILHDIEHVFYGPMDDQFDVLQALLTRSDLANKKAVILADPSFVGTQPMMLGSPKARRVPLIGIGHFPLMLLSKDSAPFGTGILTAGEEKNVEMNKATIDLFKSLEPLVLDHLKPYECTKPLPSRFALENWILLNDVYCQLCPPEFEPPRRDLPQHIRFCGMALGANDKKPHPDWYEDFVVNDTAGHPLVLLTCGTVPDQDVQDLIIPAIEACRDFPVRLVVCGVHLKLPADFKLPENARYAAWIAFDEVFAHTSLIISNAGYGGITQALGSGIPMIVAGTTEDKTDTSLRAEMTGAAINLRCQNPTVDQLKEALSKMLHDPSYKERAMVMKAANVRLDAVGSVVAAIEELVGKDV